MKFETIYLSCERVKRCGKWYFIRKKRKCHGRLQNMRLAWTQRGKHNASEKLILSNISQTCNQSFRLTNTRFAICLSCQRFGVGEKSTNSIQPVSGSRIGKGVPLQSISNTKKKNWNSPWAAFIRTAGRQFVLLSYEIKQCFVLWVTFLSFWLYYPTTGVDFLNLIWLMTHLYPFNYR